MTTDMTLGSCATVRGARREDAPALRRMFDRCTPESRYRRFHGLLHALPEAYLQEALDEDPCRHDALVLEQPAPTGAELAALASARRLAEPGEPAVEVGLLVEDAWQGRGWGTCLLTLLAARARARGVVVLRGDLLAASERPLAVLRRTLGPVAVRREGFVVHAAVRL